MKVDQKQTRYFLQLLVHMQKHKITSNQDGFAMLMTSILTILMFSMLSVYLFSANLYKSVANAVVDNGTTFYAAESGMNTRANTVRSLFEGFSQPDGISPLNDSTDVAAQMQQCILNRGAADNAATVGTGAFRCQDRPFEYKEPRWKAKSQGNGSLAFEEVAESNSNTKYRAYSFIRQITGATAPDITKVPAGEPFAGLNMQEYKYRVYTTAQKESGGLLPVAAQTLLQMDFNSRVIPLFQFAAFYDQDLEITSSSPMSLNGPIHSNRNIWFAPGGAFTGGQVTAAQRETSPGSGIFTGGNIYKSLAVQATHSGTAWPAGRSVTIGNNAPINVTNAWNADGANTQVTAAEIAASNGLLSPRVAQLNLPPAGFLGRTGNYFNSADLRVVFDPNNAAMPVRVQSRQGGTTTTFTTAMVRSLRQPVMAVTRAHQGDNRLNEWNTLCASEARNFSSTPLNTTFPASLAAFSEANAAIASNALGRALAKTTTIYSYSQLNNSTINGLGDLLARYQTELNATTLTAAQRTTLTGAIRPREIANRAGNCFLPAPIQILANQRDRQENRDVTVLQSNINSLTVWNRDGLYSNDGVNVLSAASAAFARKPDIDASGLTTATVPVGSYEWMGMAASDTTERGLVWHFSMDPAYDAALPTSYAVGFTGGRWLPGPLTLATDLMAYVQGDFNNPGGVQPTTIGQNVFAGAAGSVGANNLLQKEPSSVLADAIGVLSNICENADARISCLTTLANGTAIPAATATTVNAAFLAGTSTGAGVNNYMRMFENWGGVIFRYTGSFVSFGIPNKFSTAYRSGCNPANASATCYYNVPSRDFNFDNSFNSVSGLPPLTPQAVYLKQKVFKRDYKSNRANY